MYSRVLDIESAVKRRSVLLLGPRQAGKSTLLQQSFPEARWVNLLEADTFRTLSAQPEWLRQTLQPHESLVIIDEVQKLPALLDEVHLLMERNKQLRFVLTGSSARKLKRGQANLLAGRARILKLHPLVSPELQFTNLKRRISIGSLPAIFDSNEPWVDLDDYVGTYLQEEIYAESLTRSVASFSRFLEVVATTNTEQVNYTKVANDCGVPPRTVQEHYQILEDTLIGHRLPVFQHTIKRKAVATPKFYLFDVGVANVLRRTGDIQVGSPLFGKALEHLIFLELRAYLDYHKRAETLSYWRSRSQFEVDFVIENKIGIEVKASSRISRADYKGLLALAEEVPLQQKIVVSTERIPRRPEAGIEVLPVQQFLRQLWDGKILD